MSVGIVIELKAQMSCCTGGKILVGVNKAVIEGGGWQDPSDTNCVVGEHWTHLVQSVPDTKTQLLFAVALHGRKEI